MVTAVLFPVLVSSGREATFVFSASPLLSLSSSVFSSLNLSQRIDTLHSSLSAQYQTSAGTPQKSSISVSVLGITCAWYCRVVSYNRKQLTCGKPCATLRVPFFVCMALCRAPPLLARCLSCVSGSTIMSEEEEEKSRN